MKLMELSAAELPPEIDLLALVIKARGVRCRVLQGGDPVTLRPKKQIWREVPGQILSVKPIRIWSHAGTTYLSGELISARTDIGSLNLVPLRLEERGTWRPDEEYWGEPGEEIDRRFLGIKATGPRPMFEMEQVIPGEDPEDDLEDPILEAAEYHGCGAVEEAMKIMGRILETDLRCLDAHAHLGNWAFNSSLDHDVECAKKHYEIGVRIGELSLGDGFDGVLKWGMLDNRPFLRCLHGYGLSLWRLGDVEAAKMVFERMLRLNPSDNQGARILLADIDDGLPWRKDGR